MIAIEAIEILKHEHDYAQLLTYVNEALKTAISALEKQIPKKPDQKTNKSLMHINHGDKPHEIKRTTWEGLHCPMCGGVVGTVVKMRKHEHRQNLHDFCPDCGQAIDWSDTNG